MRLLIIPALLLLVFPGAVQARHHTRYHARHATSTHRTASPAEQGVKVWVNTNSGVYHFPGERWYGRTQEGEYMSEGAAKRAGYRPTRNGQ